MEENVFKEIFRKLKMPWKHTAFILYFYLMVLAIGGIDIYYSIFDQIKAGWTSPEEVSKNMAAYALAIISASLVDVSLNAKIVNKASFTIISIATAVFSVFLFHLCYTMKSIWSLIPAVLGMGLGLAIWVLANHENDRLNDRTFDEEMRGDGHGNNWQ